MPPKKISSETKKPRGLPPRPPVVEKVIEEDVEEDDIEENVEEEVEGEGDEVKAKGRHRPTLAEYVASSKALLEICDAEIDRRARKKETGIRTFRKMRKLIIRMQKDFPQVVKARRPRDPSKLHVTPSGFSIQHAISPELAKFLKVPPDTRLSRLEATRGICVYAHLKEDEEREEMLKWKYLNPGGKRNLQDPADKKAIVPDAALSKLLRYSDHDGEGEKGEPMWIIEQKQNKSDENG